MPPLRYLNIDEKILGIFMDLPVPILTSESLILRPSDQIEKESILSLQQIETIKYQVSQTLIPLKQYSNIEESKDESGIFSMFDSAENYRQFSNSTGSFFPTGFPRLKIVERDMRVDVIYDIDSIMIE